MLTPKSRAISRIVNRREFPSCESALCISELAGPLGTPWRDMQPASCWGVVFMANPA